MEAGGGMVAGSHKRNELVRIRHDSDSGVSFSNSLLYQFFFLFLIQYTCFRSDFDEILHLIWI